MMFKFLNGNTCEIAPDECVREHFTWAFRWSWVDTEGRGLGFTVLYREIIGADVEAQQILNAMMAEASLAAGPAR